MIAIIPIGTKQYSISKGAIIEVDLLPGNVGDTMTFDSVYLVEDKGNVQVGTPTVRGRVVKAKIVSQGKGEKIDVLRYKNKVRHRRHIGFRPHITTLEILSIE